MVLFIIVDGGWGEYSDWSSCTVTCGGGTQSRSRSCSNPLPAYGGKGCSGETTENKLCGSENCPGKKTTVMF